MTQHILMTTAIMPQQQKMLEDCYTLHRYDLADNKTEFMANAGKLCTGVVTSGHFSMNQSFVDQLSAARIVACSTVGYDTINVDALTKRSIRFTNTPDVLTDDVADIAILLMLAVRRGLLSGDNHVRSGHWAKEGMMALTKRTKGSRVGLLGLGRIGTAIANRCTAMGQDIGYYSRTRKDNTDCQYFDNLINLAEWADVLIAAVPGGEETQGMVSQEIIERIGPQGTFINISRGTVVDESALIQALQSGTLGSAGLDVYLNEPDINTAFSSMANVVLYPHHSSGTIETREAMSQLVVDNLAAFFADDDLLTPVN